MRGDKRYARRHHMRHEAWLIAEDGQRCECVLSDISDKGARINVPDVDAIADNFLLLLAANGAARRRCRVVWRKPRQIGVKFETRPARERAAPVLKPAAGITPAKSEAAPAESA
jgi:PilZ domain-containing protein